MGFMLESWVDSGRGTLGKIVNLILGRGCPGYWRWGLRS